LPRFPIFFPQLFLFLAPPHLPLFIPFNWPVFVVFTGYGRPILNKSRNHISYKLVAPTLLCKPRRFD
jgi:hypothetical protein